MPRVKTPVISSDFTIRSYDSGAEDAIAIGENVLSVRDNRYGGITVADSGDIFDMQTGGVAVPVSFSVWSFIPSNLKNAVGYLFAKTTGDGEGNDAYDLRIGPNRKIQFSYQDIPSGDFSDSSSIVTDVDTYPLGSWAHIVVTVDPDLASNQEKIYLNGVLVDQETANPDVGVPENSNRDLYIGGFSPGGAGSLHEGDISNFVMYKHGAGTGALTAGQVTTIYNNGIVLADPTSGPRGSDIVGWYKLDGNPHDSSGNNRHGTNEASTSYIISDPLLPVSNANRNRRPIQEVVSGQKEQTLPFIFGVRGFPSLRRGPQVR